MLDEPFDVRGALGWEGHRVSEVVGGLGHHASVPEDDDMLVRLLDADFAGWASELTSAHRAALKQGQRSDRFYERIQRILRGDAEVQGDVEADEALDNVLEAIDLGSVVRDVAAWRGVRNATSAFARSNSDLAGLVNREVRHDGLLAVSTSRTVAVEEFTDPSFGGGAALLRVTVPAQTPAAWLPIVGDPAMRYQCELLLGPGHSLHVGRISHLDYSGVVLPVLEAKVI